MTREAITAQRSTDHRDIGFTLLELMIVTAILSVVLIVAGAALLSLSKTASRNDSMVADEQAASTTLAQLSRDIRSAHTISFPTANFPSGATPAYDIQLAVNQPGGGTAPVLWVYQPTAKTLTREVQVGASFSASGPPLTRVANGSNPIFTYYYKDGTQITSTVPGTIATCATRIDVELYESSKTSGVATFHSGDNVALTDQLNLLTAPGVQPC